MYTMNLVLVAALTLSSYTQSEQSVTTVQPPSVLAGSVRITSDDSVRITDDGSVRITGATNGAGEHMVDLPRARRGRAARAGRPR